MPVLFDSLLAVFLVIGAGWLARATTMVDAKHWPGLERITYVIFFPAVVIDTLRRADLGSVPVLGVGGTMVAAILIVAGLLLASRTWLERSIALDGPGFTSLFQGSTRWNTFVGLALAGGLYGPAGLTLMAVAIAAMIPLLNLLAIFVLVRFAGGPPQSPRQIALAIATNPFIVSVALGLILNMVMPPLPNAIAAAIDITGKAALAAGLLVVGATLDMRRLAKPQVVHALAVTLKLVFMPLLAIGIATLLGLDGVGYATVVIAASVPTASGAYVLARQMGGDAPLMAEILTLQTLAALLTMPLLLTASGAY